MKNILIPLAALSLAACTPSKVADKALQYAREQIDTTGYVHRQLTAAAFHTLTFDSFGELRFVQGKDTTVRIDVAAHPDYISRVEALTADSVLAQVDCQSISVTAGQQTLPVSIQIPSSGHIFAVGNYSVQCQVTTR